MHKKPFFTLSGWGIFKIRVVSYNPCQQPLPLPPEKTLNTPLYITHYHIYMFLFNSTFPIKIALESYL